MKQDEYRVVLGYAEYECNIEGEIRRISDGFIPKVSLHSDGYMRTTLRLPSGKWRSINLHRVIALAWTVVPSNYANLVVDHLNGDKLDNRTENFEWVTSEENVRRFMRRSNLLSGYARQQCSAYNLETGEYEEYETISDLKETFRISKEMFDRLTGDYSLMLHDVVFRRFCGIEDVRASIPSDVQNYVRVEQGGVHVLNLVKETETFYPSLAAFAKSINMLENTLVHKVMRHPESQPFISPCYVVKRGGRSVDYREIKSLDEEIATESRASVRVAKVDKFTGALRIFSSATECAKNSNLTATALNYRLKLNDPNKVFSDGYRYYYYNGPLGK